MQRDQSFTHPCMSNYTLCFQAPGISTHHSWLWQETTTLEETLLSPHTLRLHGWCRLWVCHCCSAVKSGRDISKWWIQRWNLPQWYWVCQIKPKPRNIGLEESTFAEVLWTLRAWFGSLKMQGVPSLIFFFFFFFNSTPAPTWYSLREVGWRVLVALTLLRLWCMNEYLQQPRSGTRSSQLSWLASTVTGREMLQAVI